MLSKVIGQESAKRQLLAAFNHQRLAHAYLLAGEEGLGAEELAIEMAKFIMCARPDKTNSEPCQACSNCRKISAFQHPDVHYYFPVLKSTDNSEILSMLEDKSQELYFKVKIAGGSLHIGDQDNPEKNSIRGLLREIGLRSYEGNIKVFIVTFVEEMNQESANALLKILEEPPPNTLYFLTTGYLQTLLPTIVSRCQLVKLFKIKSEIIESALRIKNHVQIEESRIIAKLADGNYAAALQLLSGDFKNKRELMIGFLLGIVAARPSSIIEAVDTLLSENKKDKALVIDVLNIMATWFQDAFYVNNLRSHSELLETLVINHDKIDRVEKFTVNFPSANLDSAVNEIEKAVDLISRNVYLNLILINLGLNLRKIIFHPRN
ncbi:hypothetical protein JNM05_04975 [bacterium]|nr:hypothetical protein [bacterium]